MHATVYTFTLLSPTIIMPSIPESMVDLLRLSHGAPSLIDYPLHDCYLPPLTLAGVEIIWWKDYIEWHIPANQHFQSPEHAHHTFRSLFQCDPDPDGRCLAIFNLVIHRRLEPLFCTLPHVGGWESCRMLRLLHYFRVSA